MARDEELLRVTWRELMAGIMEWMGKETVMSEQKKTVVDVLLVKKAKVEDGKVVEERADLERVISYDFTDKTDAQIREAIISGMPPSKAPDGEGAVAFAEKLRKLVVDAGGPDRVEVLVSRPFCA